MATTIRTPLAALNIDNVRFDDTDVGLAVINRLPENGEERVKADAHLSFWVVAFSAALSAVTRVFVTVDGIRELAYDAAGGGFQTGWDGPASSATLQSSPGSGVSDELLLVIDRTTDYPSLALVHIEVFAETADDHITPAWTFTVETTSPGIIDEMLWIDPRRVRARFIEPMQTGSALGGTCYLQNLSSAIEFVSPDKIRVTNIQPTADWIGYWFGLHGSVYPQNNRFLQATAVSPLTGEVTLAVGSRNFKDDGGVDKDADGNVVLRRNLRATITPYRLEARIADELPEIVCAYEPTIEGCRAPTFDELPSGADASRYVVLDFHDDVSISRKYRIHVSGAKNDIGDAAIDSTFDFTTPSFGSPARRIELWDLFPETDKDEDLLGEAQMRKMSCVLQDMLNVLWHRCDQLPLLSDPDSAPRDWIPYLLYSMGNPFRFNLTELQQRRLIAVLAAIFKQTGTVKVIEDTLAFFLGLQFQVNPFITADWWSLGTSTLGIDAILGPSTEFARNAYEIIAPQTLTVEQRRIVVDIATTLDPLYMHLIRIVEPGDTPGTLTFWVLGESSLGFTTQLAP